jgi:hypothetical protein
MNCSLVNLKSVKIISIIIQKIMYRLLFSLCKIIEKITLIISICLKKKKVICIKDLLRQKNLLFFYKKGESLFFCLILG